MRAEHGPVDREIIEHYAQGAYEHGRLGFGVGRLELVRTRELLERFLPAPPAVVADVGGAAGIYASWLAGAGYAVHLSDLVPLHVEQARDAAQEHPFSAVVADARELYLRDRCVDVVLLLGPLYHLTERGDRMRALREAHRVLRPGGVIACAAVSRYASLLDGVARGFLEEPAFAEIVERDLRSGQAPQPRASSRMVDDGLPPSPGRARGGGPRGAVRAGGRLRRRGSGRAAARRRVRAALELGPRSGGDPVRGPRGRGGSRDASRQCASAGDRLEALVRAGRRLAPSYRA